jgi:hypothetical protein
MMKRPLVFFLSTSIAFAASAQSFELPVPAGWTTETFPIPIEFAPQIAYSGEEHIRFAPGWGDPKSEDLWTYCFLWWIKPDSKVSKESLEKDIQAYYSGLVGRNIVSRKIDAAIVVPTTASFQEATAQKGDRKTYEGSVKMLDYLSLRPITLNINVHVIPCDQQGNLGVFFAISPQAKTHALWKQLNSVREGFKCKK